MTATTKKFIERMGGKVDRAAGVIRGVKLLGRKSRNKRTYTDGAMREAAPNYNGKKVYLDHPERDRLGDDRRFKDWVGVVESAQFQGGAIYGDIRLRKQSEHFEELLEAAESFDGFFGMSHVAEGDSRFEGGEEVIESIAEVYSVDIVTEPATAAGLFESTGTPDENHPEEIEPVRTYLKGIACAEKARQLSDELPKEWQPVVQACIDAGEVFRELLTQHNVVLVEPVAENHQRDTDRYNLESFGPAPPITWNG